MKTTFLCALAMTAFAANAQLVQDIPNAEALKIDGDYSKIEVATLPEDGSDPKPRTKDDGNGIIQFDNMCNEDVAELKLNNTITSPYILKFQEGCKIDGTHINFSLINEAGDVAWSTVYDCANNNKSWSTFYDSMVFIEDPLEAGIYTFRIEFLNDAGGTKNTANLREFFFEARESIVSYSVYTTVDPGDEAGRIVMSPNQNNYLEGSEVVLTATANSGYKFAYWEINGDIYEENPYTLYVMESTDVIAYFDELKMDNDVPGWINIDTRAGVSKNGKVETKTGCSLDGESINEGGDTNMLGNYRNGDIEYFELNVTEDGSYELTVEYSSKPGEKDGVPETPQLKFEVFDKAAYEEDATTAEPEWTATLDCKDAFNNWSKFKTAVIEGVDLTEGSKIFQITFIEPVSNKYTVNILAMGFSLNGDFGQTGVQVVEAQDKAVKAYNVFGVEVEPNAKGLIIFSDGKKVFNK